MARKKGSSKGRVKRLIPMIGLLGLLIAGGIFINSSGSVSADTIDPYYRAKLEVDVTDGTASADNSDCATVVVSALKNEGYLVNKPLSVVTAGSVTIDGTTADTGNGTQTWCIRSNKIGRTTVTVRLKDRPNIKKSFSLVFLKTSDHSTAGNTLAGSKMEINVENPYNTSPVTEFPNNSDCIVFAIDLNKKDGTPLIGETILIQKPRDTSISLIDNTDILVGNNITSGEIKMLTDNPRFCLRSSKAMSNAKITAKLTKIVSVNRSFNFTFAFPKSNMVKNVTDKNNLLYNRNITFQADIPPWLANNIKSANIVYMYTRHVFSGFRWKNDKRTVTVPLNCDSEGHCAGVIDGDHTRGGTGDRSILKGRFTYRFDFIDSAGHKFSGKSVTGSLK